MELNRNQVLAVGVGLFVVLIVTVLLLQKLMAARGAVALPEVTEAPELTTADA
jgi:hypothetical protein